MPGRARSVAARSIAAARRAAPSPPPAEPTRSSRLPTIVALQTSDIRFPTSRHLDGSDALNPDPDYSAAYVIVQTDAGDGLDGHGFAFTVGRGNEVQLAAIAALAPLVVGLDLDDVFVDMARFWRRLVGDSQLRWL